MFRYGYRENCWNKCRANCHWFFCDCCGCGFCKSCLCPNARHSKTKNEKIYGTGIRKLYTEIDLLEVVKQLRISRFMSNLWLSKNQKELVKFMKIYTLNR